MMIHRTQSLCPVCLRPVDAFYEREGQTVYLRKTCPEHGSFETPAWDEEQGAPLFNAWRSSGRVPAYPLKPFTQRVTGCPFDCGLCPDHSQHTCTGLIEITSRCSLCCPVCFADAGSAEEEPSVELISRQMDALFKASGACNLQLSGGEPTMREDLENIIALAARKGFGLVQLNSNGLRLGREKGYAERLRRAGLDSVYLQFDAMDDGVCLTLRGRRCLEDKLAAIEACASAGLGVILVCTLVRGINEHLLGQTLRWAVAQGRHVRGLHIQPVSSFGRFPWELAEAPRVTLPEIMSALESQSAGLVHMADFHAPCCEHALCSFSAVYARKDQGLELIGSSCCSGSSSKTDCIDNAEGARISRSFTAAHWRAPLSESTGENAAPPEDAFARFLARSGAAQRFTVSAMAFQDAMTLDLERLRNCCIHVVDRSGRLIPFCAYNLTSQDGVALYRSRGL